VCTSADGSIVYITAHIFYEDLAKIQESLLPLNSIEQQAQETAL